MVDQRRTFGAVAGNCQGSLSELVVHVGGADGDYVGVVARHRNRAVAVSTQGVVAPGVPRRDNNNDPRIPCGLHSLVHWVQCVTFIDSTAQRKV